MPYQRINNLVLPDVGDINQYIVEDLVSHLQNEQTSTVLLLESPHTSEVSQRYPLAGTAGVRVAKAFLGTDEQSIGEILHNWRNLPSGSILRHIGIMNVCRLPMQCDPYCRSLRRHEVLRHLKTIRNNPAAKTRRNRDAQNIEADIKQDLERRIADVKERIPNVKFVVCGIVARTFARKVGLCNQYILYCVPHPGRVRRWPEHGAVQNMVEACRLTYTNRIQVGRIGPCFF